MRYKQDRNTIDSARNITSIIFGHVRFAVMINHNQYMRGFINKYSRVYGI